MAQIDVEYVNHSPYKLGQFGDQLDNMTAQEVFNIAVEHLLLQSKRSKDEESAYCLYNGNGVCCAAAPFIKDYKSEMEHRPWEKIRHTSEHLELISKLQVVHDQAYDVDDWPIEFEEIANDMELAKPQILIDKLNAK